MDKISKEKRSWNMSRIMGKNTSLEIGVRKYLFSKRYRYRVHYPVTGIPDIAFPKKKVAIFVNGCFWHSHGCKLTRIPSTRTEFWKAKLEKNTIRDEEVRKKLSADGWKVIVLWECRLAEDPAGELTHLEEQISGDKHK